MTDCRIDKAIEYFEDDIRDDNFENYRKTIVTTMAFLIGVPEEKVTSENRFDITEFEKLKTDDNAKIIRNLCKLRTQFLRNYKNIDDAKKFQMRPLESMSEYLDIDAIKYLRSQNIEVNITNAKSPTVYIAYINQYIVDNIEKIKPLIPDWIKFEYIKSLFLIPGGYAGHNGVNIRSDYKKIFDVIFEIGKTYAAQRSDYPFQMYIHWPKMFRETDGNILYNDLKFLKLLYAANGDSFQAGRYVIDAKETTKENVYYFLNEAENVAIFVDCENVDPYAFASTILNLNNDELSKIKKIVLYDDVNTSTAWDYIADIINIPVEKKDIERILDNKSLVDITMTAGVCEEYYKYNVESIILASSDSDFWALIKQLPNARFLVLNEFRKTSNAIIDQLDKHHIQHCFMSDFAQDKVQQFKSDVLYLGLMKRIKMFNQTGNFGTLDIDNLLQELFYEADIDGAESQLNREKEAFFKKYLKNGLLIKPVMADGKYTFQIELHRK